MSKVIHPNEKRILFSHEGLFILILFNITVFADIFIKFNIKIILFIRDPIDHMLSRYSQGLKRSGNAHSVDHTAEKYNLRLTKNATSKKTPAKKKSQKKKVQSIDSL